MFPQSEIRANAGAASGVVGQGARQCAIGIGLLGQGLGFVLEGLHCVGPTGEAQRRLVAPASCTMALADLAGSPGCLPSMPFQA
ncbi:hypothetical protein CFN58_34250, partial [Pseudomonas avellanae]